jgi:hypothetical protein
MRAVFLVCANIGMLLFSAHSGAQDKGSGTILNVDTVPVEFILRGSGDATESQITLAPGEAVRLRKFENYELFLQSTVYDLNAKVSGTKPDPWASSFYSLFRSDDGTWKLGKGLISEVRKAARRHVASVEHDLNGRWNRSISPEKDRRVDPAQLRFCQAFMLEAFLREKFNLRVRIHPDPWLTGEDPDKPGELNIEAITCHPVPLEMEEGVVRLVKDALNCPHANTKFSVDCVSDRDNDSIWDAFLELCETSNSVVNEPHIDLKHVASVTEDVSAFWTGNYFGIDGSGSNLDSAAVEIARLKRIKNATAFEMLSGAEKPILDDIRVLLELNAEEGEDADRRRRFMSARIEAHYGCSFLYIANPKNFRFAASIDHRPVLDIYVRKDGDTFDRMYHSQVYTTVREVKLANVGINIGTWESARYRHRGYSQLIKLTRDENARSQLIQKYEHLWVDLPLGEDVGHRFKPSDRFTIEAVRSGAKKSMDFFPVSNRNYLLGDQSIIETPR